MFANGLNSASILAKVLMKSHMRTTLTARCIIHKFSRVQKMRLKWREGRRSELEGLLGKIISFLLMLNTAELGSDR